MNDPVAKKLLQRAAEMPGLEPPADKNIKTLYIGGVDERITDRDLRYESTLSGYPNTSFQVLSFSGHCTSAE